MQLTDATRKEYADEFGAISIASAKKAKLAAAVQVVLKGRSRYEAVERALGVPWWFVGIVHMREASCNFNTYLGNGEPLNRVTQLVPAGRGPFSTWEAGAIDALKLQKLHLVKVWDLPAALYQFEAYNGFGYRNKGVPSPYLWSFSNQYTSGKYVADGHYSAGVVDVQPGCASMLFQMILLNLIPALANKVISMATDTFNTTTVAAPVPTTAKLPNTSAGVTVNKAQNLATHVIVGIGAILGALGLTQVHSMYDAVTNSSLIGGFVVSGLAMLISNFNVNGSNDNTLDLIDKVITALTPAQQVVTAASVPSSNNTPATA